MQPSISGARSLCSTRYRVKTRGHFPSDEAAAKLIWLALRNIMAKWRRSSREWKAALNQFAILYADRSDPAMAG